MHFYKTIRKKKKLFRYEFESLENFIAIKPNDHEFKFKLVLIDIQITTTSMILYKMYDYFQKSDANSW